MKPCSRITAGNMTGEISPMEPLTNVISLKRKLIFTTLNGLFPLSHSVKDFLASSKEEGNASYSGNTFDLMTFRDHNITETEDDDGKRVRVKCDDRYHVPSEITWLLKSLVYKKTDIYGVKLGVFSRNDELRTEDFEMLVIAELE